MVGVAQLVEPRIVIPVVEGSSPFIHPIFKRIEPSIATRLRAAQGQFASRLHSQVRVQVPSSNGITRRTSFCRLTRAPVVHSNF